MFKKTISLILVVCIFCFTLTVQTGASVSAVNGDVISSEGTLSNCHKLLTTEKKLTIGYIGGSITYGGSAIQDGGSIELSYVNRTSNWFKEQYPDATIETVNAGVSDTATNFGLFRLEKTLMNENGHDMPDLVFIEFTVNDWTYPTQSADDLKRQVESVFLNIWQLNPYAEIAVIITATSDTSVPRSAHIAVAEHYGVPYVDVGIPMQKLKNERGYPSESAGNYYYTVDNLHPSWRGYEIYFNEIKENLLTKYLSDVEIQNITLYPYGKNLPKAQNGFLIDKPQIITADNLAYSGGFTKINSALNCDMYGTALSSNKVALVDNYLKASSTATLSTEFYGTTLGVMFMMNNAGINMTYCIDGGELKTFTVDSNNFGWQMYNHLQVFMLAHNLSEGKHTVEFSFSPLSGATSMNVQFAGVMTNNYTGITVTEDISNGTVYVERNYNQGFNTFTVTATPDFGKTLKANGLTYTYGGNTYPIITRKGAVNADGSFNSDSQAQCTTFKFKADANIQGIVVNAEFADIGDKNIAVIGTSINQDTYKMRFRSRAYRTYIEDGVEYSLKSCGTLLFKEAQTDIATSHNQLTNGKDIKTTQLFDRTDDYYEYACHINYGSADSEFLDDDYYAYAYAIYVSANGDKVTLYSSETVKHSYLDVLVAAANIS